MKNEVDSSAKFQVSISPQPHFNKYSPQNYSLQGLSPLMMSQCCVFIFKLVENYTGSLHLMVTNGMLKEVVINWDAMRVLCSITII